MKIKLSSFLPIFSKIHVVTVDLLQCGYRGSSLECNIETSYSANEVW